MGFHVTNRNGDTFANASDGVIDAVLAELEGPHDPEHPNVSLTHESEWTLSAFPSGLLVWENVEEDAEPRQLQDVARDEVRRLWLALARGDIIVVEAEPWQPGYGTGARSSGGIL